MPDECICLLIFLTPLQFSLFSYWAIIAVIWFRYGFLSTVLNIPVDIDEMPATLLKKRFCHRCFPFRLSKNTFFAEHLRTTTSEITHCWTLISIAISIFREEVYCSLGVKSQRTWSQPPFTCSKLRMGSWFCNGGWEIFKVFLAFPS